MNVYKAKYRNGTLRLVEKPLQHVLTGDAIVIFPGEALQRTRTRQKQKKQRRPYALCKNEFSVTSAFDDPLPQSFTKSFTQQ